MVAAAGTGKVIDRYGFVVGLDPAMALRPETEITAAKRENERSLKWQSMIASWQTFAHGEGRPTLKRRVRKGIPDGVRGHIWSQAWKVGAAASSSPEDAQRRYLALQGRPSEMDEQIRKDLHRTMPGHAQFVRGASGQEQLFRVCHALAVFRPDVGYNQAEAYVAAALLTYMAEDEAFWTLQYVCSTCGLDAMWAPAMEGWASYGAILDGLVKTRLPRLHRHMEAAGLTVDLYALQWFTTLFVKGLPFESTLRVWDIYLCEQHPKGSKILFRVALAVLAEGERELLTMHDLPQLVERIRQLPFAKPGLQGDKLIAKALSINLKTSDLFPPALPSSRSRGKA